MHPLNVYGVVLELAQEELIQKLCLMVCTWTNTLKYIKSLKGFDAPESVIKFYAKVTPTKERLAKLFYSHPKSEENRVSYRFFYAICSKLRRFLNDEIIKISHG